MFSPVPQCWICGGATLVRYHECRLELREYERQDAELAAYSGTRVWLVRCRSCGFGQPEALPTLPCFFDRMYDQHWSEDWVEREFESTYKDLIFRTILRELARRVPRRGRLLDIGAHAGRFMHLAQHSGWSVAGVELNPRTASCAARRTGAPVHRVNAHALAVGGHQFSAVTLTDVLEHIPEPMRLLSTVARLVAPGGCIAVKVPCGVSQWYKERALAALLPSHTVSLAENLVHVNHFSTRSLRLALERAGFGKVTVRTGAPELPDSQVARRRVLSHGVRLGLYAAARLPGAVHTPLAFNLQAYATRIARP